MLFGATSCTCGYHAVGAPSDPSVVDVSYREALRVWWRAWCPVLLIGILLWLSLSLFAGRALVPLGVASLVGLSAALFLLVPRLVSGRYRDFSLVVVAAPSGPAIGRLRPSQQARVWFFLWWRHLAASLLAGSGAAFLFTVLLFGVPGFDLFSRALAVAAGLLIIGLVVLHVLVVGPVLVKMLVGHPFAEFLIEVRRGDDWAFSPGRQAARPISGGPRNTAH